MDDGDGDGGHGDSADHAPDHPQAASRGARHRGVALGYHGWASPGRRDTNTAKKSLVLG